MRVFYAVLLAAWAVGLCVAAGNAQVRPEAVGYGRFTRQSTWVLEVDSEANRVLSRVDVLRDSQQGVCYAVYRWFTGTGGANTLGTVACDKPGIVYATGQ